MPVLPEAQRQALEAAYAVPARAYHSFAHVGEVMRQVAGVAQGPGWAQPREVWLAALYHDAIYEPGARDNEARSAALAREAIARWLPDAGIDAGRVAGLIELTARHGQFAPADFPADAQGDDARRFLDCDMAILGAAPAAFDAYDRAIAAEYRGRVPGWLYRINRRRFLAALLRRERIYLSDDFHARLDAAARANLRRALNAKR
ncbi:hypothetical protein LDO32_05550 [Luteimonas sp. Y-2-2-4F]|nr:hypothetical protein [Luteimonas sp. Y-2-2-4F]MCD9031194.1 hypothetical protein [Luteimonas sp. Y-2-2-4F]